MSRCALFAQGIPIANYAQRDISNQPQRFATEIVAALQNPEYRQTLATSGLNLIGNAYSPDVAYGELMTLLRPPNCA